MNAGLYRTFLENFPLAAMGLILAGLPLLASAGDVTIKVGHKAQIGDYLTDSDGRTLYLFEKDNRGSSTCYDACAQAWPPLISGGSVMAGKGVDQGKVSTVTRKDGSAQVTYRGWPLYYFVKDDDPGDTYGQEVNGFGGEWYAIAPDGSASEAGSDEDGESGKHSSGENW